MLRNVLECDDEVGGMLGVQFLLGNVSRCYIVRNVSASRWNNDDARRRCKCHCPRPCPGWRPKHSRGGTACTAPFPTSRSGTYMPAVPHTTSPSVMLAEAPLIVWLGASGSSWRWGWRRWARDERGREWDRIPWGGSLCEVARRGPMLEGVIEGSMSKGLQCHWSPSRAADFLGSICMESFAAYST